MGYGQSGMFHDSGRRIVVLLDHLPPHFHAKRKGQWEVRVFFLEGSTGEMFQVVWLKGKEVPRAGLKLLEENVTARRADILQEWERKVLPQ